jgi:internalin A
MQRRTWHYLAALAVLASFGPTVYAGTGTDKNDAPKPLPPEIVKAWRDAGADVGWMKDVPVQQSSAFGFWAPWRKEGEAGATPAFRFPERDAGGPLAKLPDPGTAFGLDFHCGFQTGATLKELAALKNLQSLNLGARLKLKRNDLELDAELKELAAAKNLRALYLFHTHVTDKGLKELAGLKDLQILDLYSTAVTDAGLKSLARMKSLQALNLGVTRVTDAGLKELAGLKNLRWLNLRGTDATDAGVAALRKDLPKCKITTGDD